MSWLVSAAHAQQAVAPAADAAAQGSLVANLLPFALVLGIFYFLLIRPQQRKYKLHQEMIAGLKRGDKVITGGGIIGSVTKIESDDIVLVQIAEGVVVEVARATIVNIIAPDSVTDSAAPAKKGKPRKSSAAVPTGTQVANDN